MTRVLGWCSVFTGAFRGEGNLAQDKRSNDGKEGLGILGYRMPGPLEWELDALKMVSYLLWAAQNVVQ